MTIVSPQNWHLWRSNGIGSSDASIIVGVNPYQSRDVLLYTKAMRVPVIRESAAIKHGQFLERYIREFLNTKYNLNLKPLFCVHDQHRFLLASVDGIDTANKVLVEIKAPTQPYYGIPIYYLVQVYHQLMVTGYEKALFVVYCRNSIDIREIHRNETAIQYIMEKEIEFWNEVLTLRRKLGITDNEQKPIPDSTANNPV
jgi:putative phage-type endonuclease